jgi:hypothetical protein
LLVWCEDGGQALCLYDTERRQHDIGVRLLPGGQDLEACGGDRFDRYRSEAAVGRQLLPQDAVEGQKGNTRSTLSDAMLDPRKLYSRAWRVACSRNLALKIGEPRTTAVASGGEAPSGVQNSASIGARREGSGSAGTASPVERRRKR